MKYSIDYYEGQEVERICYASDLDRAKAVEKILDVSPFDYAFDLEESASMVTGLGVAFYVLPEHAAACKRLLIEKGIEEGIERDKQ